VRQCALKVRSFQLAGISVSISLIMVLQNCSQPIVGIDKLPSKIFRSSWTGIRNQTNLSDFFFSEEYLTRRSTFIILIFKVCTLFSKNLTFFCQLCLWQWYYLVIKCLFSIYANVVWCPTWSKILDGIYSWRFQILFFIQCIFLHQSDELSLREWDHFKESLLNFKFPGISSFSSFTN
jgi:hypothetical protein